MSFVVSNRVELRERALKMMTLSTVLARHGVGGGTNRHMPKGLLMSGFEKPPPFVPTAGKRANA